MRHLCKTGPCNGRTCQNADSAHTVHVPCGVAKAFVQAGLESNSLLYCPFQVMSTMIDFDDILLMEPCETFRRPGGPRPRRPVPPYGRAPITSFRRPCSNPKWVSGSLSERCRPFLVRGLVVHDRPIHYYFSRIRSPYTVPLMTPFSALRIRCSIAYIQYGIL